MASRLLLHRVMRNKVLVCGLLLVGLFASVRAAAHHETEAQLSPVAVAAN